MTTEPTSHGPQPLSATLTDAASLDLSSRGSDIVAFAQTGPLRVLRRLQESAASAGVPATEDPARERKFLVELLRRVLNRDQPAPAERDNLEVLRAELADHIRTLELRIDQFVDLAALANSPPEYAHQLREHSVVLSRLVGADAFSASLTADTFRELTRVLDLVQLTRRDVERRTLHDPRAAARYIHAAFSPDDDDLLERVLSVPRSTLQAWADGASSPTPEQRDRLVTAAQITYDIRESHTPRGVGKWFCRSYVEFDGQSPIDLLDSGDKADHARLRQFARSLRGQVAS